VSRLAGSPAGWWLTLLSGAFAAAVGAGFTLRLGFLAAAAAAAFALASGLVAAAARLRFRRPAVLLAVLLFLGIARGGGAVLQPAPDRIDGHLGERGVVVTGAVRDAPLLGAADVIVDVERLTDADTDAAVSGALLVTGAAMPALSPGDRVEIDASAIRAPGRRPGPRSEAALEREGVQALVTGARVTILRRAGPSPPGVLAWVQRRLVTAVNAVLPEPTAGLLLGIAFGIRQPMSPATRAPLQDSGLIHIVVVSGLKVVLVVGMIAAAARALQWSRRRTLLAAAPVVAAYVLVSGAGPAAVRSALMAGAAFLGRIAARRVDPLPLLAVLAAAMLGIAPALAKDPGFQLSFMGTAGILLLAEPLARRLPGPRLLAEPFAVTVAAQLATVPVMAGTFGVVSLVGPFANALVLPLLPVLIVLGTGGAALSALHPALGWLPLQLAGAGTGVTLGIAGTMAALPGAALRLGSWPLSWSLAELSGLCAGGFVVLLARRNTTAGMRRRVMAAAAAAGVAVASGTGVATAAPDGVLHVTVLDVGAAPAVLVQSGSGALALIDGGASAPLLLQALGRATPPWTRHIGLVVLTGGEQAAVAGLAAVAGQYSVGAVVEPTRLNPGAEAVITMLEAEGASVIQAGTRPWTWAGASWQCLTVSAARTGRAECAVSVGDRTGRVLVLGDVGTADEEELAGLYPAQLRADVLVAPPGGALAPVLLGAAQPSSVAVPAAAHAPALPLPAGYSTRRTAGDGDLAFAGGPTGLEEAT